MQTIRRVPVVSLNGLPLMPTKPSKAKKLLTSGKATQHWSDLGVFYIKLTFATATEHVQPIVIGIDPGKLFTGIAVQSKLATLLQTHTVLPFPVVKKRMEQRAILRRTRRGRRVGKNRIYALRAHRQCRFSNRRSTKIPPSIKANKLLELRIVRELLKTYPVVEIVVEYMTGTGKGFTPVAVAQTWLIGELEQLVDKVSTKLGWETSNLRQYLGLVKVHDKKLQVVETHAVDAIALACTYWKKYVRIEGTTYSGKDWTGDVQVTESVFKIVQRPKFSRRQLCLNNATKGGIYKKYGGSVLSNGRRKGDLVKYKDMVGYVSGETGKTVSISDGNWKRIVQAAATKVNLIRRNVGLCVI